MIKHFKTISAYENTAVISINLASKFLCNKLRPSWKRVLHSMCNGFKHKLDSCHGFNQQVQCPYLTSVLGLRLCFLMAVLSTQCYISEQIVYVHNWPKKHPLIVHITSGSLFSCLRLSIL